MSHEPFKHLDIDVGAVTDVQTPLTQRVLSQRRQQRLGSFSAGDSVEGDARLSRRKTDNGGAPPVRCSAWSGDGFEGSEHDIRIHKAELCVMERAGQRADDAETQLLPEPYRRFVGGDDEVELHGAESESACLGEAVLAHASAQPEASSRG